MYRLIDRPVWSLYALVLAPRHPVPRRRPFGQDIAWQFDANRCGAAKGVATWGNQWNQESHVASKNAIFRYSPGRDP